MNMNNNITILNC